MADTAPKKKKIEKRKSPAQPSHIANQQYFCCSCGTAYPRQRNFFPASHSPMYAGNGYIPICNECIDVMYARYRKLLGTDRDAMYRMCMKLDIYWSEDIFESVMKSENIQSYIRTYISRLNLKRYFDKTFDQSLAEEGRTKAPRPTAKATPSDTPATPMDSEPEEEVVPHDLLDFWGAEFDPEFYFELDRRYKKWTADLKDLDRSEEALYKQICLLEASINRDTSLGKNVSQSMTTLTNLLGSLNLKPSQKKDDADAELENMPLGVGIQKWEESRPLPETPEKLKDIRGTIKNITTWYLGHACKMVGLRNSYTKLYEEAVEELRVKHPEYDEEDDDTMLYDIFGDANSGGDST